MLLSNHNICTVVNRHLCISTKISLFVLQIYLNYVLHHSYHDVNFGLQKNKSKKKKPLWASTDRDCGMLEVELVETKIVTRLHQGLVSKTCGDTHRRNLNCSAVLQFRGPLPTQHLIPPYHFLWALYFFCLYPLLTMALERGVWRGLGLSSISYLISAVYLQPAWLRLFIRDL